MQQDIVRSREIQRNYRKLIDEVKKTKRPIYIGARFKPEAVLIDVGTFEYLSGRQRQSMSKAEVRRTLDELRKKGRQRVNLAKFVHEDRKRH